MLTLTELKRLSKSWSANFTWPCDIAQDEVRVKITEQLPENTWNWWVNVAYDTEKKEYITQ